MPQGQGFFFKNAAGKTVFASGGDGQGQQSNLFAPPATPIPAEAVAEQPAAAKVPHKAFVQPASVDDLRKQVTAGSKQHSVQAVARGDMPVGVEGRGGKDLEAAKQAGLYTTTVNGVGIFAASEAAARPVADYLNKGGKYGTTEFSKLLGYSDAEIGTYGQFLHATDQAHLIGFAHESPLAQKSRGLHKNPRF